MNVRNIIITLIGGALLLFVAIYAVRVAGHYPQARAEVGPAKMMQIESATREKLAALEHDVLITYYVSGREHMPSHMRRLQRSVTDLLEALKRASDGRVDYQIIDPEDDPEFVRHAAHQRVAPFRVRSVGRDTWTERTVWSTLHIACGPHAPAVINGVSPQHLPRLQALIVGQLSQMIEPRQPVFGLIAPEPYRRFERFLDQFGEVRRLEMLPAGDIPRDIDVLFWMDPGEIRPGMVRQLQRFLDSGRSAVIAGSRHRLDVTHRSGGRQEFTLRESAYEAEELLVNFGLRPVDGLVIDQFAQTVPDDPAPRPVPFLVRCIGPNQDFRDMRMMPNGHLLFAAPTPFALDGDVLAERGYNPVILATTSDRTQVRDMIYGPVDLNLSEYHEGETVPKLPLMVWLRPQEPSVGSVVFSASSSPFRDGSFGQEIFAHPRLAESLVRTLASNERLVMHEIDVDRAEPLPPLTAGQRLFWRVVCIGLVPALLLGIAWYRGAFRVSDEKKRPRGAAGRAMAAGADALNRRRLALRGGAALVIVLALASLSAAIGWRADMTAEKVNQLAPTTRALAASAVDEQAITATLHFSRHDRLPPDLRPRVRDLQRVLGELRRAGASIETRRSYPEDLDEADRAALHERGITPVRLTARDEEVTTVRRVYATLELTTPSGTQLLHFHERGSFENVEFRLAFALWRLQSGRDPHIAFASDVPRLSAAEVYHDFQQQNLHAPSGTDVYMLARQVLRQHDFRVTHVNPSRPEIPEDVDLIIWMQPRRDILPMLQEVVEHLHRGTPVMIAGQHYSIQARQYRGTGFRTVYWPQPQVMDLHRHYFPDIGIELVQQVLFDDMKATLPLITHINRDTGERDYEEQHSALPFLIRAVAANFNRETPVARLITRGLGDQVMPFASYLRFDEDLLAEHGLDVTPVMTTSDRSWSFAWEGGWIPQQMLEGPAAAVDAGQAEEDVESLEWLGRRPLAAIIEGTFPQPKEALTKRAADARDEVALQDADEVERAGRPSRLLLVGCSHTFRNERLIEGEYRGDHFVVNAAAALALPEDLAAVAGHRRIAPGFDYLDPDARLRWRVIVVSTGPALMLAFAIFWTATRHRRPRAGGMNGTPERSSNHAPDQSGGRAS